MDETPDGGRRRFYVGVRECPSDSTADELEDCGGRRDSFTVLSIAGLSEHHLKQCGTTQRKLDVGYAHCREVFGRRRRGLLPDHVTSQFTVADRGDGRNECVTVGEVAVWGSGGNAGTAGHSP